MRTKFVLNYDKLTEIWPDPIRVNKKIKTNRLRTILKTQLKQKTGKPVNRIQDVTILNGIKRFLVDLNETEIEIEEEDDTRGN